MRIENWLLFIGNRCPVSNEKRWGVTMIDFIVINSMKLEYYLTLHYSSVKAIIVEWISITNQNHQTFQKETDIYKFRTLVKPKHSCRWTLIRNQINFQFKTSSHSQSCHPRWIDHLIHSLSFYTLSSLWQKVFSFLDDEFIKVSKNWVCSFLGYQSVWFVFSKVSPTTLKLSGNSCVIAFKNIFWK